MNPMYVNGRFAIMFENDAEALRFTHAVEALQEKSFSFEILNRMRDVVADALGVDNDG